MLNKQGPGTRIDWTNWSMNPIGGCLNGCSYCYLVEMSNRFETDLLKVRYKPEMLEKFARVRKINSGDKIFMGSSGDMWGEWVPEEQIDQCLRLVEINQEYTFQFLTKNPERYGEFKALPNAWYGATIDGLAFTSDNLTKLVKSTPGARVRFISFEPVLKRISKRILGSICFLDWLVIGPDSTKGAEKPKAEWIDEIVDYAKKHDVPVWMKDPCDRPKILKELPVPRITKGTYSV